MKRFVVLVLCVLVPLLIVACGSNKDEMEEAAADMEEAAEKMAEAGKEMGDSMGEGFEEMAEAMKQMGKAFSDEVDVEPVDFRDLKKLLPGKAAGFKRVDASGEKNAIFGIKVSSAEATYEGRKGASIDISITDLGTMKGVSRYAGFAWSMADIDKETDTGYERTISYKGHKGFEEYDEEQKEGKIEIIVAGRFAVEIDGYEIKNDKLKDALEDIDIDKLEGWKDKGISH
jgi:hypothetical protein